LIKEKLFPVI